MPLNDSDRKAITNMHYSWEEKLNVILSVGCVVVEGCHAITDKDVAPLPTISLIFLLSMEGSTLSFEPNDSSL
jgi:hypothetical protein